MNTLEQISLEEKGLNTLVELTGAFEGIASLRVSKIKDLVFNSTKYFNQLWEIYRLLKVEEDFQYNRSISSSVQKINKELFIIITAESGFSGDIDLRLIELMLKDYSKDKNELIVIGYHGALQLAQRGVEYLRYFKLPKSDQSINTDPLVAEIQKYNSTVIYYQEYLSLLDQEAKKIDLNEAIKININQDPKELITEKNFIFEPSPKVVARHLEQSFIRIAISQKILSSKLAQYASRFKAMSVSNQIALDQQKETQLKYNRTKRYLADQKLREIVNAYRVGLTKGVI